jgi:hypothetical protein
MNRELAGATVRCDGLSFTFQTLLRSAATTTVRVLQEPMFPVISGVEMRLLLFLWAL